MLARHDLTTNSAVRAALIQARRGTAFFDGILGGFADADFDEPSLLPGWTRRHVVAHVGYNARAVARLVEWARTGIENPMYASPQARNEEIDLGATLSATALRALFQHTAIHLDAEWRDLPDAGWRHTVGTAQGRLVPASETVWMRTREVWIHAIDLAGGASFADIPQPVLVHVLQDVTGTWATRGTAGGRRLLATDTNETVQSAAGPDAAHMVTGTLAQLARWATGRGAGGRPSAPRWL